MQAFDQAPTRRVIVVGRTGLDAKLRLDPTLELIRVPTGLDALGEMVSPLPGGPTGSPVIIVGDGTELDEPETDPATGEATDRFWQFAEAARRVDPGVLLLHTHASPPSTQVRFDGSLSPEDSAATIKALLESVAPQPIDQPTAKSRAENALPPGGGLHLDDRESQLEHDDPDHPVADEDLVRAILRGVSIDRLATDHIAARLGLQEVRLLPAEAVPSAETDAPAMTVRVEHEGQLLGHLAIAGSEHDDPPGDPDLLPALERHAAWLAPWLALAEQHRRLRVEAFTDPVTGAWNRRYFDRFIRTALDHARNHRHSLTVMIFDVDNFKTFNDRFGHDVGDEVLAETVRLLKSTIRPSDRVCRIGGDEFAVVFYEPDGPREQGSDHPSGISQVAKRFQQKINDHTFPKLGVEAPGELTISGGLATFPWDARTAEDLVARADQLAMQSKRAGKNAITFGPHAAENG